MKQLLFILFLFGLSSFYVVNADATFDNVKWTYEVIEDYVGPRLEEVSIDKQSLSGKTYKSISLKIPLKNVECHISPPMTSGVRSIISRAMSCQEKGNKTFSFIIWVNCGLSKKTHTVESYVSGIHCENEKKCNRKEYKIIYSCSM